MLAWLNAQLGVTYDNLPGAQNAYAISCGVDNWNSLSQGVPAGAITLTRLPLKLNGQFITLRRS